VQVGGRCWCWVLPVLVLLVDINTVTLTMVWPSSCMMIVHSRPYQCDADTTASPDRRIPIISYCTIKNCGKRTRRSRTMLHSVARMMMKTERLVRIPAYHQNTVVTSVPLVWYEDLLIEPHSIPTAGTHCP
jgi:hypothetical protein